MNDRQKPNQKEIADALAAALPKKYHQYINDATHLLLAIISKASDSHSKEHVYNNNKDQTPSLLQALQGREIILGDKLVIFGVDGQLGDVDVRDIAGGNITTINITIGNSSSVATEEKVLDVIKQLAKHRGILRGYRDKFGTPTNLSLSPLVYLLALETASRVRGIKDYLQLSGHPVRDEEEDIWLMKSASATRISKLSNTIKSSDMLDAIQKYQEMLIYYTSKLNRASSSALVVDKSITEETLWDMNELTLMIGNLEDIIELIVFEASTLLYEEFIELTKDIKTYLWKRGNTPNMATEPHLYFVDKKDLFDTQTTSRDRLYFRNKAEYQYTIDYIIGKKLAILSELQKRIDSLKSMSLKGEQH